MSANVVLDPWLDKLGFSSRKAPDFYFSSEFPEDHTYSFYLRELKLPEIGIDAVYFVDDIPVILFKTVQSFEDSNKLKALHKKLWNQSLAPVIILSTPKELRVYSGISKPADEQEDLNDGGRLLKTLRQVSSVEELNALNVEKFESGDFFNEHISSFDPDQRVDRYLLRQLRNARFGLIEKDLNDDIACSLLGRSIFVSYLCDREVLTEEYFKPFKVDNFRELLEQKNKDLLYSFFTQLKADFNGDIFPLYNQLENTKRASVEQNRVTKEHVALLNDFFRGTDFETGQLGFWPYDFKYIPIEMISGVYEQFLGGNKKAQKVAGAYYTPRFLADIVIDTAFADRLIHSGLTILDPSCGSGIFLVGMYRRAVESWIASNGKKPSAEILTEILKKSIWGVDINVVACHIAAFSLYLAMLNYLKPRDIVELKERGVKLPPLVGSNIIAMDFFDNNCPVHGKEFDLIIGNPPWAAGNGERTTFEQWAKENKYPIAARSIAQAFVWKAGTHVREGGQVALLLPSNLLYNHSQNHLNFKKTWFKKFSINKIINLTDLRHFLFSDAVGPGIVVKFDKTVTKNSKHVVEYISPKAEPSLLNMELLPLAPEDVKAITSDSFIRDPLIWKKALWGTDRDRRLIERLEGYQNLSDIMKIRNWHGGRGYERNGPNPKVCRDLIGKNEATKIAPFFIPLPSINKLKKSDVLLYRHGALETYKPPHVLVQRGISSKYGKKIIAAYSSKYLAFNSSIISFSGPKKDKDTLKFLAAVLNSNVTSYFFFHTAANYGVWHDAVHIEEYERFPFPLDRLSNALIKKAFKVLEKLGDGVDNDYNLDDVREKLNEIVYEFYDFSDEEMFLVEDTLNVVLPSVQPTPSFRAYPKILKSCADSELRLYLQVLLNTLNGWSHHTPTKIGGRILKSNSPLMIVELYLKNKNNVMNGDMIYVNDDTYGTTLSKIHGLLPNKISRNFYINRNLRIFDRDRLYIVKPKTIRDWTRTAALNDADDILLAIEGKKQGD